MAQKNIHTIKKLIEDKRLDLLLAIELSKEIEYPNRKWDSLFGQFACLYDLIPTIDINTQMILDNKLREYFKKFLVYDKNKPKEEIPHQLLRFAYRYLDKFQSRHYLVNSNNKLYILDEKEKENTDV